MLRSQDLTFDKNRHIIMLTTNFSYTQYGPIKNGRIKNQGSDFEKK